MTPVWDWSCVPNLDPETAALARAVTLGRHNRSRAPRTGPPPGQVRATVVALLRDGLTVAQVASKLDRTRQCVRTHARLAGFVLARGVAVAA